MYLQWPLVIGFCASLLTSDFICGKKIQLLTNYTTFHAGLGTRGQERVEITNGSWRRVEASEVTRRHKYNI